MRGCLLWFWRARRVTSRCLGPTDVGYVKDLDRLPVVDIGVERLERQDDESVQPISGDTCKSFSFFLSRIPRDTHTNITPQFSPNLLFSCPPWSLPQSTSMPISSPAQSDSQTAGPAHRPMLRTFTLAAACLFARLQDRPFASHSWRQQ